MKHFNNFLKLIYFIRTNENESSNKHNDNSFLLSIQSICILKLRKLRNTKWESDCPRVTKKSVAITNRTQLLARTWFYRDEKWPTQTGEERDPKQWNRGRTWHGKVTTHYMWFNYITKTHSIFFLKTLCSIGPFWITCWLWKITVFETTCFEVIQNQPNTDKVTTVALVVFAMTPQLKIRV